MLALLALPLLLSAPPVVDDEVDTRSVGQLRRAYSKSEDVEERKELLLLLASHAVEKPSSSRSAWSGVAEGLKDDSYEVRQEAVRLVRLSPDRDFVVKALTAALDASTQDLKTWGNGGRQGNNRGNAGGRTEQPRRPPAQDPPKEGEGREGADKKDEKEQGSEKDTEKGAEKGTEKEQGEAGEGEEKEDGGDAKDGEGGEAEPPAPQGRWARFYAAIQVRVDYVEGLIEAIGELPDDRSVKSMKSFLEEAEGRTLGRYRLPAGRALGQLGTRAALEAVRDALEIAVEEAAESREAREGREERAPRGGAAGAAARGPTREEVATGLHEVLVEALTKAGVEELPEYDDDVARKWKKVLAQNARSFPGRLGRIENEDD